MASRLTRQSSQPNYVSTAIRAQDLKNPLIDTIIVMMSKKRSRSRAGFGLENLVSQIDRNFIQTHCALDDTLAVATLREHISNTSKSLEQQFVMSGSKTLTDYFRVPPWVTKFFPELTEYLAHRMDIDLDYQPRDKPGGGRRVKALIVDSRENFCVHCYRRGHPINLKFPGIHKLHAILPSI